MNQKISLSSGIYTTTMIILIGVLVFLQWFSTLKNQLELSASDLAVTISEMESIQYNLTRSNGSIPIQRKTEELKLSTRTQYIHVLNKSGIYYAHTYPVFLGSAESDKFLLDKLSDPMQGVSIRQTESYPLPSVEAIAPVYYQGELVGLVITGMLNGRAYQDIRMNQETLILFLILAVFISLYSSGRLSSNIKKSMHGMEPSEISRLLGQRAMTLENLKEGIITIDQDGRIIYFNDSARKLAGMTDADLNRPGEQYFFGKEFFECLDQKNPLDTELITATGLTLQSHFEPILGDQGSTVLGATVLIEDLTEVRARAEELTGIRQINEGLRAQNHEFLNKLHTISGLIQLQEYDEAIGFINGISHKRKEMTVKLGSRIKDPSVAGLLLGKYNKSQEQKTGFYVDDSSILRTGNGMTDMINLIMGNLIENSLEELSNVSGGSIRVRIHEGSSWLTLQIRDTGSGIEDQEQVFQKGFSTKGPDRGIGLYLIRKRILRAAGTIEIQSVPGDTRFTVRLPLVNRKEI
ncbi:ATP-binding protein [Oceanispirochaeta sp. M1]|uniref:ATP-binding protein n=1 Tax=Oceanispirochaeta sp. M1 TaxID=2283433 RepID=UPI0014950951|nr:ATP-binding protein [Oceanispirochaeta sp. M1]